LNLLSADTIDPAAIETERAAQVATVDQASRRIAQCVVDTAAVLTPAQRKALAAHIAQMHATAHQG
jgi:Spy/CpxP family protein refolding chaperone